MFGTMKGYMVVLLVCLASLQWTEAEPRGSRSGGRGSRSSSGRSYSSSSSRSSSGCRSSSSGSSYCSSGSSSGSSYGRRSSSSRSSYGSGGSSSRSNYGGRGSRSSSNYGRRGSGSSGSYGGRRSIQSGGYSQTSNHGYGSSYSGYGSSTHTGGKGYSYASKGYGTRWGTNFKIQGKHTGYSKKTLGLGVAAGFVGGAVVGGAATSATYGVYHRYNRYRDLMYRRRYGSYGNDYHDDWGWGRDGWNPGYYNNYYLNDQCRYSCPYPSVCRYGFCVCDIGYERRYGTCRRQGYDWSTYTVRRDHNPLTTACINNEQCFDYDFNLICDKSGVTMGSAGTCMCRTDMRWNQEAYECQLYTNVDCSKFTYDSTVSPAVEKAVRQAETRLANETEKTYLEMLNETITENINIENVLKSSLLTDLDVNDKQLTDDDITEAYCRDVDALSHEFQRAGSTQQVNLIEAFFNQILEFLV